MELEIVILSEISQLQNRDKYCMFSIIFRICMCGREGRRKREKARRGKEREIKKTVVDE